MNTNRSHLDIERLLLSKGDTAESLGVSVRTVSTFIAKKSLPCRKIGRRTLIPADAVRRFAKGK
jgi:excisionase family DNA binding protein